MFIKFYHKELNELKDFQRALMRVYDLYLSRDFNLEQHLIQLLHELLIYYKNAHTESAATWIQGLLAEIHTAKRGIHPFSLERITIRKHELVLTTCYKIIQNLNDRLRADTEKLELTLQEGRTLLKQIFLGSIQLTVLTADQIKAITTQREREGTWTQLLTLNNGMQQLTRSLSTLVSTPDIYLLMEELTSQF